MVRYGTIVSPIARFEGELADAKRLSDTISPPASLIAILPICVPVRFCRLLRRGGIARFSVYRFAAAPCAPRCLGWCCLVPFSPTANFFLISEPKLSPGDFWSFFLFSGPYLSLGGNFWESNTKNPKDQRKRETAETDQILGASDVIFCPNLLVAGPIVR